MVEEKPAMKMKAADRDLDVFKSLSKNTSNGPYPYQHLFDYLDHRATLAEPARTDLDLADLTDEIKRHPDQPEDLYMLADPNANISLALCSLLRYIMYPLTKIGRDDCLT